MRTDSTAALPQALGRYRILSRLGRGGMAEVFLSKTTGAEGIEKRLVVKRILPAFARQPKFITMFIDEAKVAMRLNHPNIVQVYAFEQVGDEFLLAMEFVDGPDLGEVARLCREQGQPMPPALAAYVALEVAKALEYAHNRRDEDGLPLDIVHRDVSPQNILLSFDGGIKLTDFGVAKAGLSVEAPGVIKGKFAYMPPEQARGEAVDRRADVYALGVVLAELLLGRPMFPGERGEALLRRKREGTLSYPGDHNPAVPAELDALVRRATLPDPQRRIPTARALAVALSQFLHGQPHPYDASSVEAFLRQLLPHSGRERRMSSAVPPPAGPAGAAGATASGEQRERRQVFVIALQLRPAVASVAPPVLAPDDRQVLADIAYKYDAVLSDASRAPTCLRLLLGLGTPSVNEALKAMRLALDLRDAVEALGPEPGRWTVAVGIVRGIVATVRAASGRLLRYDAVGNVLDLPARLAEVAAPAEILVLGEVYRLVRRVFAF
ncbi:MAG: serine/threonine protein kinase, partial [Polyangiales bacterium]